MILTNLIQYQEYLSILITSFSILQCQENIKNMTSYSIDDLKEISVWVEMAITPKDIRESKNNLQDLLTMFPLPILKMASKRLSSSQQKKLSQII